MYTLSLKNNLKNDGMLQSVSPDLLNIRQIKIHVRVIFISHSLTQSINLLEGWHFLFVF